LGKPSVWYTPANPGCEEWIGINIIWVLGAYSLAEVPQAVGWSDQVSW